MDDNRRPVHKCNSYLQGIRRVTETWNIGLGSYYRVPSLLTLEGDYSNHPIHLRLRVYAVRLWADRVFKDAHLEC
jgi:hypothetical protein